MDKNSNTPSGSSPSAPVEVVNYVRRNRLVVPAEQAIAVDAPALDRLARDVAAVGDCDDGHGATWSLCLIELALGLLIAGVSVLGAGSGSDVVAAIFITAAFGAFAVAASFRSTWHEQKKRRQHMASDICSELESLSAQAHSTSESGPP